MLPTAPDSASNAALLQTEGVVPYNMCILKGFPTSLAKTDTSSFPFGVFFANADTLYVADEGKRHQQLKQCDDKHVHGCAPHRLRAGLCRNGFFNKSASGAWNHGLCAA